MATKRDVLKGYFRKNSIPTAGQFAELIDTMINQADDGISKVGDATTTTALQINDNNNAICLYINRGTGKLYIGKLDVNTISADDPLLTIKGNIRILEPGSLIRQQAWQPVTFAGQWVNADADKFNPAGYFKDTQGIVHLRGVVQNTSGASLIGNPIFSLPPDYSPEKQEIHTTITGTSNEIGRIDILPSGDGANNGSVILMKGSPEFISLDGITFRAAE
jgi:hypothetical protein